MFLFYVPYDFNLLKVYACLVWIYFFSMPLCVVYLLKRQLRDENFSWKSPEIVTILMLLLFGSLSIAQLLIDGIYWG